MDDVLFHCTSSQQFVISQRKRKFIADGVLYSLFAWVWILQIPKHLALDKYNLGNKNSGVVRICYAGDFLWTPPGIGSHVVLDLACVVAVLSWLWREGWYEGIFDV